MPDTVTARIDLHSTSENPVEARRDEHVRRYILSIILFL